MQTRFPPVSCAELSTEPPARSEFSCATLSGCDPAWGVLPSPLGAFTICQQLAFHLEVSKSSSEHQVLDSQLSLESDETFRTVHDLLSTGLEWAADAAQKELQHDTAWSAIIEALAQLAPPPKGPIDRVDVSGALAGHPRVTYPLTRSSSDRIGNERKRLPIDRRKRTREGFVREFDKDRLTFILRTARGDTIRSVSFSEEQYGDVWLAFDAERPVTIVMEELPDTQVADLVSITLMASDEQQHEGHEDASTGSSS